MDPTISPSCATWLSMSCERTTPSLPCVESSSSQAGMTNTWPSLSLNFEMRLPWVRSSVSHLHHSYFNAAQRLVGERPVGQGFGQVDAAHHIRAVESARVRATRKTPVTPVAFLGRAIS